tara:strand:+ start:521 stop:1285 length:765 start_codon:yes stop_codon:yes gene_type:complete
MTSRNTTQQKHIFHSLLFSFFVIFNAVFAQEAKKDHYSFDYLFPGKQKSSITFSTGIPYVAIAEYSYGFADRFSLGLLAGTTPKVEGYGIRIKSVLFQKNSDSRIYAKMPILYYPQTQDLGGEPWLLTWPVVNYEKSYNNGIRLSYGIGVVAAACANDMMDVLGIGTHEHHSTEDEHHEESHHDMENMELHSEGDEGFMGDVWNTVQAGITLPLKTKWVFQAEIAAVMKGVKIAGSEWVGGPPVILTLGVTKRF